MGEREHTNMNQMKIKKVFVSPHRATITDFCSLKNDEEKMKNEPQKEMK
jgi:hypothetical protein